MPITDGDISLSFHDAKGIPMANDPEGYQVADFFRDGADWLNETHEDAAHAFARAEATYLGADVDGVGIRMVAWAGDRFVKRNLAQQS